jgi:hypothetical protein
MIDFLFKSRSTSGRWVYLAALVFPVIGVLSLVSQLLGPYPIYGYGAWISLALVFTCALQWYRPCIAGWLVVLGYYVWAAYGAIVREIEAFQDIGSEDHGRWEGWGTEWILLTIAVYFVAVAVGVALQVRRKKAHAT